MSVTRDDIEQFCSFANARLAAGGENLNLVEIVEEWQFKHESESHLREDTAALRATLQSMDRGEKGRSLREFATEFSRQNQIEVNSNVLVGKSVITGTRLAVEFVVELLANGWTEQQIMDNYPGVTRDDVSACLHYATAMLKSERVYHSQFSNDDRRPPKRF